MREKTAGTGNWSVRAFREEDLPTMAEIWNQVVEAGEAFPQEEMLTLKTARAFFGEQTFSGVLEEEGEVQGLYILHPNNIGRCGHLANASYAVRPDCQGRHVGERLVRHSLETAREKGFKVLQFNAVVATNAPAIHLYEKVGFHRLGTVPGGFRKKSGEYADILLFYIEL